MKQVLTTISMLLLGIISSQAYAHHWITPEITINQTYEAPEPASPTIIQGISDRDLSQGLTAAMASGAHQFDFATFDWQGSVTGSWELDTSSDAVSFGVAKRFEKMDALWHGNYTQTGNHDFITIGATFRF